MFNIEKRSNDTSCEHHWHTRCLHNKARKTYRRGGSRLVVICKKKAHFLRTLTWSVGYRNRTRINLPGGGGDSQKRNREVPRLMVWRKKKHSFYAHWLGQWAIENRAKHPLDVASNAEAEMYGDFNGTDLWTHSASLEKQFYWRLGPRQLFPAYRH